MATHLAGDERGRMVMLTFLSTPLLFFLATPGWGLPELPSLPSLENVLPDLNRVLPREGQILQIDTQQRSIQGQVMQLDETRQVPSDGAIMTLDQSLQTTNSPEGISRGSGYTPDTYPNVALNGGTGSGAKATVVVGDDGKVQSVTLTNAGKGYQLTDTLTADLSGGSGFEVDVSRVISGSPEGLNPGVGYQPGTYTDVPLAPEGGGSGSGAKATVVVGSDGEVKSVSLTERGRDYMDTDRLIAENTHLGGTGSGFNIDIKKVTTADGLDPGKGYKPGTYTNVPLTGGSGTGAKGTVVVGENGTVESVTLTAFGKDYKSGESLSVSDGSLGGGGGSGFSVDLSSVRSTLPSLDDVLKNVLPNLGN